LISGIEEMKRFPITLVLGAFIFFAILYFPDAQASLCSSTMTTDWIASDPSSVSEWTNNSSFVAPCDSSGVSGASRVVGQLGVGGDDDAFNWWARTTSITVLELRGDTTDVSNSGVASGMSYTLILSDPSWSIINVIDNLDGWQVWAFNSTSITLEQLIVACPTTLSGMCFFDFGSIEVEFADTLIPIPAAFWLFGSALGILGWMRRKSA
jgi:hypothetical protein